MRALDPRLTVGENCRMEQGLSKVQFSETGLLARRPKGVERRGEGKEGEKRGGEGKLCS